MSSLRRRMQNLPSMAYLQDGPFKMHVELSQASVQGSPDCCSCSRNLSSSMSLLRPLMQNYPDITYLQDAPFEMHVFVMKAHILTSKTDPSKCTSRSGERTRISRLWQLSSRNSSSTIRSLRRLIQNLLAMTYLKD